MPDFTELKGSIPQKVSKNEVSQVLSFDYRMPYLKSKQTNARYGKRPKWKIHDENIRGKIAEFAVYDMFNHYGINCGLPNEKVWVHGPDNGDLKIYTKDKPGYYRELEVKSTSPKGKCLLLPKSQWLDNKGHIGNQDHRNDDNKRTKEIPNIFIGVNVTDSKLFRAMYGTEQDFKHKYVRYKNDRKGFKLGFKRLLTKIKVPTVQTKIMGMISGSKFKKYAEQGVKTNLIDHIPTAHGKWHDKNSNVWNFAFPYDSSFILKDISSKRPNMKCLYRARYCLKVLIHRNE